MVSREPPLTQHRQDQGAGGGFQETEQRTHTHHHRQDTCGAGKQLWVPQSFKSQRNSHGPLTQMQCWRRHISASSSWEGWGSLEWAPASSDPSTPALWRASWPAASTAWFGNSSAGNRKALQRVVRTAHTIVGGELPSLQDIYTRRCIRKAWRIIKDSSHPSHRLLSLLPSGRRIRSNPIPH